MLIEKNPKLSTFLDGETIIPRIDGTLNKVDIKKQITISIFLENFVYHFIITSLIHQKFWTLS
jgi:hypothetical protein